MEIIVYSVNLYQNMQANQCRICCCISNATGTVVTVKKENGYNENGHFIAYINSNVMATIQRPMF